MFGSNKEKNQIYFTTISNLKCVGGEIVYDNFTRVMYYRSRSANSTITLTLLVNQDGSPRIYTGE
jgi:hypothetical protein